MDNRKIDLKSLSILFIRNTRKLVLLLIDQPVLIPMLYKVQFAFRDKISIQNRKYVSDRTLFQVHFLQVKLLSQFLC